MYFLSKIILEKERLFYSVTNSDKLKQRKVFRSLGYSCFPFQKKIVFNSVVPKYVIIINKQKQYLNCLLT